MFTLQEILSASKLIAGNMEGFECFIAHNYTPSTLNEITSTVENSKEMSGNIVIMSRNDRCDYINS